MASNLNRTSRRITQEASQGGSQAMLYATGLSPEDMDKAQVGIAAMWYEGNSCNMHLDDLAAKVKEGVEAAGLGALLRAHDPGLHVRELRHLVRLGADGSELRRHPNLFDSPGGVASVTALAADGGARILVGATTRRIEESPTP